LSNQDFDKNSSSLNKPFMELLAKNMQLQVCGNPISKKTITLEIKLLLKPYISIFLLVRGTLTL